MYITTSNTFFKFLSMIKSGKKYNCFDLAGHDKSSNLPIKVADVNNLGDSYIVFGEERRKVEADIITMAGINPYNFMKVMQELVSKRVNVQMFCTSETRKFLSDRAETIKIQWLKDLKSCSGILKFDNVFWCYEILVVQHTVSVNLYHVFDGGRNISMVNSHMVGITDTISGKTTITYHKHVNEDAVWGFQVKESILINICRMVFFLQYAEVQTKIVNNKTGKKKIGSEKYINQTEIPVEVIDSHYYTTIMRTEGFGVRGHMRKQHYGPGRMEWKLIWIQDFEKKGYTRKAKILENQSN